MIDARHRWLVLIGVAVAYAIAYLPVLDAGFIWDDPDYVIHNDTLRSSEGLWRMWFEFGAIPQYYPLVHTTFWVEYQLWGLSPLGYHLVNWLLHGTNAILLFFLLRRLGLSWAGLAAFVFLVHPVHVESVAWITERKNVLSGMFYLSAWLVWTRYERSGSDGQRRSTGLWFGMFALFVCGLFSKTVTATLPAAILLLNWWRDGRITRRDGLALLPLFVVGVVAGLYTAWIEAYDLSGTGQGASGAEWSLAWTERLLVVGRTFWFYPSKILWPDPLIFIYPRWIIDPANLLQWLFPIAAVLCLALLFTLRHRIGRGPLTAALFHAGTLLPALGFLNVYPFRYSFVADHFQYLGSLAAIVLLVHAIRCMAPRGEGACIILAAVPLVLISNMHARTFENQETLWTATLAEHEACWMAHNNLGSLLLDRGDAQRARHHFQRALHHKPGHKNAKLSLGLIALQENKLPRAEALFREVLAEAPEFAPAWANLGLLHAYAKDDGQAEQAWRSALGFDPKYTPARKNLATALRKRGDRAGALSVLEAGIAVAPRDASLRVLAAENLLRMQRVPEAQAQARRALELDPGNPRAQQILDGR